MEDAQIKLAKLEQKIKTLERDVSDLKAVQSEIRSMNETLVTLANELYKRLDGDREYGLKIEHRDITKDALRGK